MLDWNALVSGAVSGSVFGALASLIAPWVTWGVEKRRLKLASRRKSVAEWRQAVAQSDGVKEFRETAAYATMRPHLLRTLIERIESDTITIQQGGRGGGVNNFKPLVYDDITRVEKHWDLV